MRFVLLVFLFLVSGAAFAQDCAWDSNTYVCVNPPGCGYVNGVYTCTSGDGVQNATSGGSSTYQPPSQSGSSNSIGGVISSFSNWLLSVLEFIPEWVWAQFLGAVAYVVAQIPVPDAVNTFTTNIGNLPSGVVWFLDLIQFKTGCGMIFGAILVRFLMTWIPFAGPKA